MSRFPSQKGPYELSALYHSREVKEGEWQNYGIDGSNNGRDILWIGQSIVEHIMPFKAFLENIKLNLSKEIEYDSRRDRWTKVYKEGVGDLSYDINIKIPAHSVNESRNNLAKIENLQKLSYGGRGTIFYVFLRNLINSGANYDKGLPSIDSFSDVKKYGFPCYIESVTFEPDLDMGFFEYDHNYERSGENNITRSSFPFPKMINLSLNLKYENRTDPNKSKPIFSLDTSGRLNSRDNGLFPFLANFNSEKSWKDNLKLTFSGANSGFLGGTTSYFYMKKGSRRVLFPAFVDSFNRQYDTNQHPVSAKSGWVGAGANLGISPTPKRLAFRVGLTVPSRSLAEAKFNSYQIQLLMRMFFRSYSINDTDRFVLSDFYMPGFIERGGAPKVTPNPLEGDLDSGLITLNFETLSVEILSEVGFFEDAGGKLYPKSFKLEFELSSDFSEGNTLHPHLKERTNEDHLFPFNRRTITF